MGIGRHVDLRELAGRIRAIEERHDASAAHSFIDEPTKDHIPTGWPETDAALGGGLAAGGLHEWFGVDNPPGRESAGSAARSLGHRWTPPLCILVHLAWQAAERPSSQPWTVWIGKHCHPYPRVLIRGRERGLLDRSLFVAPRDAASRLWAIDLALRSPAVGCVVADGGGFDRAATQRIQLLARNQTKAVFSACPPRQQDELSAAQTRWRVCAAPPPGKKSSNGIEPRWIVELLRCKGMRPVQAHRKWLLEWNRAQGAIHLSARLADPAGSSEKHVQRADPVPLQHRTA
ncbi:hypothetical protein RAS2_16670 [Phycisphaerae bacterium RAS2]|nr:hypothetical protein RAS2_16670 [Phycisphaerae bacterium RAS2]